jgi:hypothetical protein
MKPWKKVTAFILSCGFIISHSVRPIMAASIQPISAEATSNFSFKKKMIFVAMAQVSGLTTNALNLLGFIPNYTQINTTGNFSDSGFTSQITGEINNNFLSINYMGSLEGELGEDITISLASTGFLGSEDISTSGTMTWFYDSNANDYFQYQYEEQGEINPMWTQLLWGAGTAIISDLIVDYLAEGETQTPNGPKVTHTQIQGNNNICIINVSDPVITDSCTFTPDGNFESTIQPVPEEGVPEPLTILASATALGFGALFKREHSKQQKKAKC